MARAGGHPMQFTNSYFCQIIIMLPMYDLVSQVIYSYIHQISRLKYCTNISPLCIILLDKAILTLDGRVQFNSTDTFQKPDIAI
jgi:hypothetical protein